MNETLVEVIREYIDFVNRQVGVYMDALAGFAGHCTRIERQVYRVNRQVHSSIDDHGERIVVWASYEDPTQPDVIHNRIIRAPDYIAANRPGGSNEEQHSHAILIFLYTYWENEIRPRLAASRNVKEREIRSDIMGDLRLLRNAILHARGSISSKDHKSLKKLRDMIIAEQPIHIPYLNMHRIFILIKQDLARMLSEWGGLGDWPIQPEEIVSVAVQRRTGEMRRQQD